MRTINKNILVFLLAGIFFCAAIGKTGESEGRPLLIKGGTVYTITKGVIPGGEILIEGGKIQKVGRNLPLPKDGSVLEARDGWIMPGFIVAHSAPIALRPMINEDLSPRILNYLDPFAFELRLCLASGITVYSPNAALDAYSFLDTPGMPKKNYSYQNAVLKPIYGSLKDMLVKEPAYLYIDLARLLPSEKGELREFFLRASDYISQELEFEKTSGLKKDAKAPLLPPDLKYYVAILKKELPVRFSADKKGDLLKALAFVDEFGFGAQILGAVEGWLFAEELGRRTISTILQPNAFMSPDPYSHPSGGSNVKNALLQKEKGVKFAIICSDPSVSTGGMIGGDLLTFPLAGSFAIRGGLPEKDALEALTLRPAELLGIADRVGSLEEGKDADIIILDGNPFDYRTYVEYTIINGKIMYDKSQSSLYKKIPKPKRIF